MEVAVPLRGFIECRGWNILALSLLALEKKLLEREEHHAKQQEEKGARPCYLALALMDACSSSLANSLLHRFTPLVLSLASPRLWSVFSRSRRARYHFAQLGFLHFFSLHAITARRKVLKTAPSTPLWTQRLAFCWILEIGCWAASTGRGLDSWTIRNWFGPWLYTGSELPTYTRWNRDRVALEWQLEGKRDVSIEWICRAISQIRSL